MKLYSNALLTPGVHKLDYHFWNKESECYQENNFEYEVIDESLLVMDKDGDYLTSATNVKLANLS